MRLSTVPSVIACSGYRPEPPRRNRVMTILGAAAGILIIYYALGLLGAGWVEIIKELAK